MSVKIWHIKISVPGTSDYEIAETDYRREEPTLGQIIDVVVHRDGERRLIKAKITTFHETANASNFEIQADPSSEESERATISERTIVRERRPLPWGAASLLSARGG